jgi:hypothetical protein
VSFAWQVGVGVRSGLGSGSVTLERDGRLKGKFRIKDGDASTFVGERADAPDEPIRDIHSRCSASSFVTFTLRPEVT